MRTLSDYQDSNGFIGHQWQNGLLEFGDCAQRLGTEITATGDREKLVRLWALLNEGSEPVRHTDKNQWWGQPGFFSRDQGIAVSCGALASKSMETSSDLLAKLLKRGGFFWNTLPIWPKPDDPEKIPDWFGPATLSVLLKGSNLILRPWWCHALVSILDIKLILDSVAQILVAFFCRDETSAALTHCLVLESCRKSWDTYPSRFARWLFNRFCPRVGMPGDEIEWKTIPTGPMSVVRCYFNGLKKPPLDQLWEEKVFNNW